MTLSGIICSFSLFCIIFLLFLLLTSLLISSLVYLANYFPEVDAVLLHPLILVLISVMIIVGIMIIVMIIVGIVTIVMIIVGIVIIVMIIVGIVIIVMIIVSMINTMPICHLPEWERLLITCRILVASVRRLSNQEGQSCTVPAGCR